MSLPLHIHVIDDDHAICDSFRQALARTGCEVSVSENGTNGINYVMRHPADLILLDLMLPDISGIDVLERIHTFNPDAAIIIVTGHPSVETAVTVIKMGAYDLLPKPCNANTLRTTVSRALEARRLKAELQEQRKGLKSIIGVSQVMQELLSLIAKAAESDCSVLITGETGTGKEMVAKALHCCSNRCNKPFITVDAGGLVDTLIESELFGHVKGAFTGAHSDRTGRFELADGGTLFLDEITNMDYRAQGKLLRVLEDRQIIKVGTSTCIPINVRILAATNSNLLEEINIGNFRIDLYYRLNVIPIHLPPLRERKEDIPVLANYFLNSMRCMKPSGYPERISDSALNRMIDYSWPGNVRELEHTMRRAVALCEAREVDPFAISDCTLTNSTVKMGASNELQELVEVEKAHIENMLRKYRNNKTRTAQALGIDRKTLWHKLRKYQIIPNA